MAMNKHEETFYYLPNKHFQFILHVPQLLIKIYKH